MCNQMDSLVEKEYADGLANQKAKDKSEAARDNILQFYNDNKDICDKAYKYYVKYNDDKTIHINEPIYLTAEEFSGQLKSRKILILTANPIERGIFIHWLSDKKGSPLEAYMVGNYSYNVYNVTDGVKEFSVIHVDPGTTGEDYTRRVINSTCKIFQPDCIVALGICYGFNSSNYHIGHVFLSESLTAFRFNFRDAKGKTISLETETEYEKQPAHSLLQPIKQRLMYTMSRNILSDKKQPLYVQTKFGKFLSTNSLMSNKTAKQALMEQYGKTRPKPLGGEMEGPGILKSDIVQEKGFLNWLIVKSICDWGERKNDLDPDEHKSELIKGSLQAYAMTNTCGVFDKILADLCEVRYG